MVSYHILTYWKRYEYHLILFKLRFLFVFRVGGCPLKCSGHGICENYVCRCHKGYVGDGCEIELCPNNCSNHGNCLNNQCECDTGYIGEENIFRFICHGCVMFLCSYALSSSFLPMASIWCVFGCLLSLSFILMLDLHRVSFIFFLRFLIILSYLIPSHLSCMWSTLFPLSSYWPPCAIQKHHSSSVQLYLLDISQDFFCLHFQVMIVVGKMAMICGRGYHLKNR